MRDFGIVFSVLLKQRIRSMFSAKAKSSAGRVGVTLLLAFSMLIMLALWCLVMYGTLGGLARSGNAVQGLFGAFLAAMLMTLFFSLATVVGTLFAAADSDILAAMPLRTGSVFMARFAFVYLGELLVSVAIALPALVFYMMWTGAGIWTAVCGVIVILLLPSLPLAVAALISLLLMRSAAFMRHREMVMTVFGVIFAVGMSLGGQVMGQMMGRLDESELFALMSGAGSVLGNISRVFPPAAWAAQAAAAEEGILRAAAHGILYIITCAASLAVVALLGSRTYAVSASAMKEVAKRGGERSKLRGDRMTAASPLMACFKREQRMVMRSPTYAMNCLLGVVMFPLMFFLVPFITQMSAAEEVPELEGIGALQVFSVLLEDAPVAFVFAGVLGIMMFATFANIAASTAISREGEGFSRLKAMPVPMSTMCYGKLVFAAGANALTVIFTTIVLIIILPAFWGAVIAAAAVALIAGIGTAALGMLVDALRPKLVWQNEAEAVKQNLNSFFGMLLNLVLGMLVGITGALASIFGALWIGIAVSLVIAAGTAVLSVWGLGKAADKSLAKIEA